MLLFMGSQITRATRPNLRHLRAFSLAVREGNISRAAEAARVTQSAVSQAVARLEAHYGCRLLERGTTGVYPTELGRVAVERIDRALERLRAATQRVCAGRGNRGSGGALPDRMLTLSQLDAFVATARAGGFKAGAKRLGISQPSVHRAVRQLQDVLGVDLLEQTSLGLAPIMVGELFDALAQVRDSGVALLLVEQNVKAGLALAERGYLMEAGRIVGEDSAAKLQKDKTVQRAFLGIAASEAQPL